MTDIASMIKKVQAESETKGKKVAKPRAEKSEIAKAAAQSKEKPTASLAVNAPEVVKKEQPNTGSTGEVNELAFLENIQEYTLSEDTKRFTYILEKKNWDILNMINTNNKEITKLIRKQYQNLKL